MKAETPALNILVGTIYLLLILILIYFIKLLFRENQSSNNAKEKFHHANFEQALNRPLFHNEKQLNPFMLITKSFLTKYTMIGGFFNKNSLYLFKEVFIVSIVSITCSWINKISIWGIGLAIAFELLFFVLMEIFRFPFIWDFNQKIDEEQKFTNIHMQINNENISQEDNVKNAVQSNEAQICGAHNEVKESELKLGHSFRYILATSVFAFVAFILLAQTMFNIYNSVSNLGVLNIGSVAIIILIDQILARGIFLMAFLIASKIIAEKGTNQDDIEGTEQEIGAKEEAKRNEFQIFRNFVFKSLCEETLIRLMNEIWVEKGEPSDYPMGASPTKKKTYSPSKVPKASPKIEESETFMNLESTKHLPEIAEKHLDIEEIEEEEEEEKHENGFHSPIKQIEESFMEASWYLTSLEKNMFNEDDGIDEAKMNKCDSLYEVHKIKVDANKFFSVQRLPKDEVEDEGIEDDGVVLVEGGVNILKVVKEKPNTMDIDMSFVKKKRKLGAHAKKRQLIITGSSPYLEYLPDMMKKERLKKNLTPSHPQIPTVSRKVL